jgi:hypothetical protein
MRALLCRHGHSVYGAAKIDGNIRESQGRFLESVEVLARSPETSGGFGSARVIVHWRILRS